MILEIQETPNWGGGTGGWSDGDGWGCGTGNLDGDGWDPAPDGDAFAGGVGELGEFARYLDGTEYAYGV
jgi:hypothetical protein